MKFRLTYEGPLRASQGEARNEQRVPGAVHKHSIRKHFHRQLRHLWSTNKFLREHTVFASDYAPQPTPFDRKTMIPLRDAVAGLYHEFGYRFVPLVRESTSLLCSLDILFLRRDTPGNVIRAGDLDNRIKTLIDALRRPRSQTELVGDDATPGSDDDPFYCLLEDDSQVSRLVVETDTLLDPMTENNADPGNVRLVISVELKPYNVSMFNLSCA